jgi:hypothetical protein
VNALVNGVRRKGKSTLAYSLAEHRARVIIIWDPNDNYRKFPAFDNLEDFGKFLSQRGYETFDSYQSRKEFTVRFVAGDEPTWEDFDAFVRIVRDNCSGTYAVIVDEADMLQTRNKMSSGLAWLVRRAPTEADAPETVHVFQTTHSPKDIYTRSRNLISDFFLFRIQEPGDLQYLQELTGDPELPEQVQNLKGREVLHWYLDELGDPKIIIETNPETWYKDIGSHRGRYAPMEASEREADGNGDEG